MILVMIKRGLILFAMPLFIKLFQVAYYESEKGRDVQKNHPISAGYLFYDPYTEFTKNGDAFQRIGFDTSEIGKSARLTPALQKIGKRARNRR